MMQLTQKLGSGDLLVQEVPQPILESRMILVKNHYSLISAGTEGSTAKTARKSLLGKARERPNQVRQVLDVIAHQGPMQAYQAVIKKLEAYSPLGYSSAGMVIGIGDSAQGFSVGDKVACAGGGYANHAEIVKVPVNLCVKLADDADLKTAAYNTLGAISLQGIRQADLRLGESCAVIGLGLLGQLACLMLKSSGIRVIGIDVNQPSVDIAKEYCADLALKRDTPGIEDQILKFTGGTGVDAVIIAAATSSTDPVNFAGAIARKRGKVVILGAVPTGFERDPHWYKKELELRMSCSYGPGRYDPDYEEKGIDYPFAYVRWTEKRNMEAFHQLLAGGKINIEYLTTHEFAFQDAPMAYDMIVNKTEPHLGIIIKYNTVKPLEEPKRIYVTQPKPISKINIAFIGAGSYAQGNLLPNLPKKDPSITLKGVMTNTGTTSKRVSERFGFEYCTSNERELLQNNDINTIFIATRHDTHADYVIKSLTAGKNVFVEKPLCINKDELSEILSVYKSTVSSPQSAVSKQLIVGYNRRFSPLSEKLKKFVGDGPMTMIYRVNAGVIPGDSWIQDMVTGGGRIIGEACHFIDYLTWINGSLPLKVFASALPDPEGHNDTVNINLVFANGSTGVVAYYANGPKSLPKEHIEVFKSGSSGIIENFKTLRLYGQRKQKYNLFNQDKGQAQMMNQFLQSLQVGEVLIPIEEIFAVSRATFAVIDSLKSGQVIVF